MTATDETRTVYNRGMFDGAAETVGTDCCEGQHGSYELQDVGYTTHNRVVLTFTCTGCGNVRQTDAYRDEHNHWQYPDPDGVLLEFERPNRPRRR